MKPVMQTLFGTDPNDPTTLENSYSACLASLLELPLEEVAHFRADGEADQIEEENNWLAARNLALVELPVYPDQFVEIYIPSDLLHIVGGKSARGDRKHYCIHAMGGGLVHDPHPDGSGLVVVERLLWFAPLDPAQLAFKAKS